MFDRRRSDTDGRGVGAEVGTRGMRGRGFRDSESGGRDSSVRPGGSVVYEQSLGKGRFEPEAVSSFWPPVGPCRTRDGSPGFGSQPSGSTCFCLPM